MFNIGPGELVAILVVALIVLGPNRLPEAVRTVGRVVGELRRISSGFQDELRSALDDSDIIDQLETSERANPAASTSPAVDAATIEPVDTAAAGLDDEVASSADGVDDEQDHDSEDDEDDETDDDEIDDVHDVRPADHHEEDEDDDDQRAAS
jgi:sec-independent protein translocase protein TatB